MPLLSACALCFYVCSDPDPFIRWTEHKDATVPDYVLGQYVTNDAAGIRSHPYSTSAFVLRSVIERLDADTISPGPLTL